MRLNPTRMILPQTKIITPSLRFKVIGFLTGLFYTTTVSVIEILQQLTTKAPALAVWEAARRGGFSERAVNEGTNRPRSRRWQVLLTSRWRRMPQTPGGAS